MKDSWEIKLLKVIFLTEGERWEHSVGGTISLPPFRFYCLSFFENAYVKLFIGYPHPKNMFFVEYKSKQNYVHVFFEVTNSLLLVSCVLRNKFLH